MYMITARRNKNSEVFVSSNFDTFEEIPLRMRTHVAMILAADSQYIPDIGTVFFRSKRTDVALHAVTWELP